MMTKGGIMLPGGNSEGVVGYGEQMVNGTKIRMPAGFKPYPTQNQMITHTLKAMSERKNAIIESPTGSGRFSYHNLD